MHFWFKLFIVILAFTCTKAHVKLIILAVLGLLGLWMIHTLAQDYQHITQGLNAGSVIKKLFTKRSLNNETLATSPPTVPEVNWQLVLSRDPASCLQSFICQLSAEKASNLNQEEKFILTLAKYSIQRKRTWATQLLQNAMLLGAKHLDPNACRKNYNLCPYSSKTMLYLMQTFAGT